MIGRRNQKNNCDYFEFAKKAIINGKSLMV